MAVGITKKDGRWVALVSYEQRQIAKGVGFKWDKYTREWYTYDPTVAAKLGGGKDLDKALAKSSLLTTLSSATELEKEDPRIVAPPTGLKYLPFQKVPILYALENKNMLLSDEMGLGKTIETIGVINSDPGIATALIVCPNSLKLNWKAELQTWLTREYRVEVASSQHFPNDYNILIINYDICWRYQMQLRERIWDLLVLDEATYIKNSKAQRTISILGGKRGKSDKVLPLQAARHIYLTGTPIPNRPVEGWTLFHSLAPAVFDSWWAYVHRYCDAHNNGFGMDTSGASNLDELRTKLRQTIMVRRLKKDVLKDLPPKRRMIIEVPPTAGSVKNKVDKEIATYQSGLARLKGLQKAVELAKADEDESHYKTAVKTLRSATSALFSEISKLRHDTAVAKIPFVTDFLKDTLDEGAAKIIVFAHHHDVIHGICEAFPGVSVSLTGEDSTALRQESVERFQKDPSCKLFVGSILAAGFGLTLTASSHVVFAELDWVPGNVTQAEDRAHRIGQKDMVLVQHVVFNDSLDARMAKILVAKQEVIDRALDHGPEWKEVADTPLLASSSAPGATEDTPRKKLKDLSMKITKGHIKYIQEALRTIANLDGDRASQLNSVGFSRIDTELGHSLAEERSLTPMQAALGWKIARKYRRQLPVELQTIFEEELV